MHNAYNCSVLTPVPYAVHVGSGITVWQDCVSAVAGNETPVVEFDDQWVDFNCRGYMGGLQFDGMVDGNRASFDCPAGQLKMGVTCTGGDVRRAGFNRYRDYASGAVSVTDGYGMTVDTNKYGQIAVSGGVVDNVTLVDTTTTNTDMRGTDSAATATDLATVDGIVDTILIDTNEVQGDLNSLITDIGSNGTGLTALPWNASWDTEVQSEVTDALNAYDPPTKTEMDSGFSGLNDPTSTAIADAVWNEAVGDHVSTGSTGYALVTASGNLIDATLNAAEVRSALGLSSANLDTQLGDVPTVSEFNARTLVAASYFDPTADTVANVTLVDTTTTNTDMRGTDNAALNTELMSVSGVVSALDADVYYANIKYISDSTNNQDEYAVYWFKNDQPVTSGNLVNPAISVYNTNNGTPVFTNQSLTFASSNLGVVRYDAAPNVLASGEPYLIETSGTIDTQTRTWRSIVGLDILT